MHESEHRVGDPERARARATLERHATDGRLTLDELADRLTEVYAATTDTDLEHALRRLPPLPSAREIVESIGKLGTLAFRGALSRREFAARKAELLSGLAAIAPDDVGYALDELTRLSHGGMLSRKEFAAAKAQLLPYV